jgi:hypothetical protein
MEALIIIAVLGVIGYLIYVNQPSTKFTKASKLLNQNRLVEAQIIFNQIILKHPLAVTKYSECFFLQGKVLQKKNKTKEAVNYYNKAIESKSLLNSKSDKKSYSNIASKAYFEIATLQFDDIPKNNLVDTISSYKTNIAYIKQSGFNNLQNFNSLIEKHNLRIADIYYELGLKNEREQNIINAKNNYSNTINTLKTFAKNQTYHNAITRTEICKLKFNENVDLENFNNINKSSKAFQIDFYYRYSTYLIKHNNFSDAEKVIDKRLNNESSEIQSLKEICLNEKIKSAVSEITNINFQIKNLYTTSTPVEDILLLYTTISEKAKDLNKIIPDVQKELESLKPSLFNRILQSYTEQKEFGKIINFIKGYPEFYKSPILLKNIGNSCVNYLRKNTLKEENYKLFIAMFLTSAYSDNVMLYSLEETLWDDEYTFSLVDSVGSSYEIHSQLPANVNYDEISETTISIGESQRFLISQFESLLNGQDMDSSLSEKINDFYDSEKKAIESIVSIIPNEIFFSTPYFAYKFKIEKEILSELEYDYNQYGNEDALSIGVLYNTNNSSSTISEFSLAKEILNNILSSIKTVNKSSFEKYTTKKNIAILKKYSSIFDDVEIKMAEVIDTVSKNDSENENLLNLMQSVIKISPTKDKLKYQFANYASNLCVSKINAGKMTNYKGLQIMNNSYKLLPNDARVCTNIIALIRMNILDILNDRSNNSSAIYSILDDIKNNISNSFKHNAGELIKTRNEILSQLPAEARTSIISGINLNSQGRQLKKGLDYLGKLGGASTVNDPLAALRERIGGLNLDLPF